MGPSGKWPPDWWYQFSYALRWARRFWIAPAIPAMVPCVVIDLKRIHRVRSFDYWRPTSLVIVVLLHCFLSVSFAEAETRQAEEKIHYGEITGTVSAVSKQGIAVEYARTRTSSSEMFLPLSDHVRLVRIGDLSQLRAGDTVTVRYEQAYKDDKEGKRTVLNTTATEVALMRRAPTEGTLASREAPPE